VGFFYVPLTSICKNWVMMRKRCLLLSALLLLTALAACSVGGVPTTVENPVVTRQTVTDIGACQGLAIHDRSVWLYGDAETGVVKRLTWIGPDQTDGPMLQDTGETYALTVGNNNLLPHPTGLTHHPELGCFIGNTVDQKGTIHHIDWDRFIKDGNLNNAVLNTTRDDLATNGTRPEFVRYDGRWLIATADYGDKDNKLRLYDPQKLAKARKTSEPGVLVAEFDCGPFVQSMHWIDADSTLVLAQNQTAGLKYRLTLLRFGDGDAPPNTERVIDLSYPTDELEGFGIVAPASNDKPGWAVMTSAMPTGNASIIRWPIDEE